MNIDAAIVLHKNPQANREDGDPSFVASVDGDMVAFDREDDFLIAVNRRLAATSELVNACDAVDCAISRNFVDESDFNPDYHVEITLSVAECRLVQSALAQAKAGA